MKKYISSIVAIAIAIILCSFTILKNNSKPSDVKYAVYTTTPSGSNPETIPSNYAVQSTVPIACPNSSSLCWIQFEDTNSNGNLDQSELDAVFTALDSNNNNTLDDEAEQQGILQKRQ